MTDEGKEIVEAVTLPECKDNVENNDGIAATPPHKEAYGLINKLTMVGGTR